MTAILRKMTLCTSTLLMMLAAALPAAAAEEFERVPYSGTYDVFARPHDVRGDGMGGTGTAGAEGPLAAWWNPATVSARDGATVGYQGFGQFFDGQQQWATGAAVARGRLQAGVIAGRWSGELPLVTLVGDTVSVGSQQDQLLVHAACELGPTLFGADTGTVLRAGVAGRRHRLEVAGGEASTWSVDLGLVAGRGPDHLAAAGDWRWRAGAVFAGLAGEGRDIGSLGIDPVRRLSYGAAVGVCLARRDDGGDLLDLNVAGDWVLYRRDGDWFDAAEWRGGAELLVGGLVAIRHGMAAEHAPSPDAGDAWGWGCGGGSRAGVEVAADYARLDLDGAVFRDAVDRVGVALRAGF
ncbi:MAG: hypothetical protein IPH09_10935 [bacterium]|nr:hypothetical protein [bacterium]